jgi:hypothetical protein
VTDVEAKTEWRYLKVLVGEESAVSPGMYRCALPDGGYIWVDEKELAPPEITEAEEAEQKAYRMLFLVLSQMRGRRAVLADTYVARFDHHQWVVDAWSDPKLKSIVLQLKPVLHIEEDK